MGYGIGLVAYLYLTVAAGFGNVFRGLVLDSLHVSQERHLPLFGSSPKHAAAVVAVAALLIWEATLAYRVVRMPVRLGRDVALVLLVVLAVGLVPEFLQRADLSHLLVPGTIVLGMAPAALYEELRQRGIVRGHLVPILLVIAALGCLVVGQAHRRSVVGFAVTNEGRTWYYATAETARDVQQVIDAVDKAVPAGRELFVGPQDLSQTPYTDNGPYYLLPQFQQKDHFYDMHPRVALVYSGRLAGDVASAEVLVLVVEKFNEPNLSRLHGSQRSNEIVRQDFRLLIRRGAYSAYVRRS